MKSIRLNKDGRITLGRTLCEKIGLKPGDKIRIVQWENGIEIFPQK